MSFKSLKSNQAITLISIIIQLNILHKYLTIKVIQIII